MKKMEYIIKIVSKKEKRIVFLVLANEDHRTLFRIVNVGIIPQLRNCKKSYHGLLFDVDTEKIFQSILINKLYRLIIEKKIQNGQYVYCPDNTLGPVLRPFNQQEGSWGVSMSYE